MRRREFFGLSIFAVGCSTGCRGYQFGHIVQPNKPNLVGSHSAGAAVFDPLIDESVAALLSRQTTSFGEPMVDEYGMPAKKAICFIGVENKSIEELADFKDQIYEQIDSKIIESDVFLPISRRLVDAGLKQTRLRPDALMIPDNRRLFAAVLEQNGQPFDYLLYATLTSGTTERNSSSQRDYLLTLELVNINDGSTDKQSAKISKGYHRSALGKLWHYNPLKT
jgi:hypothetical protein